MEHQTRMLLLESLSRSAVLEPYPDTREALRSAVADLAGAGAGMKPDEQQALARVLAYAYGGHVPSTEDAMVLVRLVFRAMLVQQQRRRAPSVEVLVDGVPVAWVQNGVGL